MSASEGEGQAGSAADAVARRSYGKLVAFLAARTGDVAAAEDALSEAFAAALADWPAHGTPDNPEAWLLTVARRKSIDAARRRRTAESGAEHMQVMAGEVVEMEPASAIPDHRLKLMFVCAHPAIEAAIRAPLMLQAVLGLDAATIASAFLLSPAAMGQRLVRAKHKIRQARIPFTVPEREELPDRLEAVLDAIYAAFAEGWTDAAGSDVAQRDLAEEALFLGELVTELLPDAPEALGLLALMLHAEARRRARRDQHGEYVPLARQDPALWDWEMIARAEELLHRAGAMGAIGRYQLEAALQSAHVDRRRTGQGELGLGARALRRAAGDVGLTGGGGQPRAGGGRAGRSRRGAGRDGCRRGGRPSHGVSALLGRPRGAVGALRSGRRGPVRLRHCHRPRA